MKVKEMPIENLLNAFENAVVQSVRDIDKYCRITAKTDNRITAIRNEILRRINEHREI